MTGRLNDAKEEVEVSELERLRTENATLRKILAHVPARIAIKAKEDAGFGDYIHLHTASQEARNGEENASKEAAGL